MRRFTPYAWLASVGLGLAGCGSEASSGSAVSEPELSTLEQPAGSGFGGDLNACRRVAGARPPLGSADITVIGNGPFDMVGTAFPDERGEITAVYESYSDDLLSSGRLSAATSLDCGTTFSAPQPLALGPPVNYRTTPSAVHLGRHQYLYFASADSFADPPTISRSAFRAGKFGDAEMVGPISGVGSLLSWPRFIEAPLGIAVAFRTATDRLASFALSLDGLTFTAPSTVSPSRSAMPRTAFGKLLRRILRQKELEKAK